MLWLSRWARRSSVSAYELIEPLTSTSRTTRRGRYARRRHSMTDGSPRRRRLERRVREASTRPRCQRWWRAVRRVGARGRSVANMPASRCFSPDDIEATSRWRSTSAELAAARITSSAVSVSSPSPSSYGSGEMLGSVTVAGRARGSPSRALKKASKIWSKRARSSGLAQRVARPAIRTAAGSSAPSRAVAARKSWVRSWVTGTPPARSARAKASRISSAPRAVTGVLMT